jgi:hypothetical protein
MQHPETEQNKNYGPTHNRSTMCSTFLTFSPMPYLVTKCQIWYHKVYQQEVLGTYKLVFLQPAPGQYVLGDYENDGTE